MLNRLKAVTIFGAPFISKMRLYSGPSLPTAKAATLAASTSTEQAIFANGCFWGPDHMFRKYFDKKGLIESKVGYIGGKTVSPNYRDVCSGTTEHAEAMQVTFDPSKVSYAELVEFFYNMHDPTQVNGQGADRGSQYRSAIFVHSPDQLEIAKKVTAEVQEAHYKNKTIATEIVEGGKWYTAEDYHQDYLNENKGGYHCSAHYLHW